MLSVGQVLLICDSDDNLQLFTYVKLGVSQCCTLQFYFILVLLV